MNPPEFFIEVIYDLSKAKETSKMIDAYSLHMQPRISEQVVALSKKQITH